MPRNNKKTRIKGLPPKLQLDQRDNTSGSYPTAVKIASDNRTGKYNVFWNDNNTIVFGDVSDIRDGIINYYRFNSGSTSDEVTPNPVVDGTASFLIRPTFSNTASLTTTDPSVTFTFQMHVTGNDAGFYTSASSPTFLPWFGPDYDPNLSSIDYYRPDYSFATGGLNTFNPGKNTAVSGAAEKPFSVAFWARNLDGNTPGTILSVARTNASWSAGIISSASFVLEGVGTSLRAGLFDSASNGIGINVTNGLPSNTWRHIVFTYDGSTTFSGMNFYIDGKWSSRTNLFQGTLGSYGGMQTSYADDIVSIGALGKRQATIFGGDIDEMIFFNRVLNSGEIHDLYLSRVSIHTPSVENRFANGVYLGAGLPTNSPYWYDATVDDLITDFSTSLHQAGAVKKGVGDNLAHFTPGQSFQPFKDLDNPAVDGKSTGNQFYAIGSRVEDIGPGFSQPLWSKTKIEIDLSTNQEKTLGQFLGPSASAIDAVMAYYNHSTHAWSTVGSSQPATTFISSALAGNSLLDYFTKKAVGFGRSILQTNAAENEAVLSSIRPIKEFTFPFGDTYFVPTSGPSSSILYPLNNVIDKPFLLEKIVVDFSGAFNSGDYLSSWGGGALGFAASFFFILNQQTNAGGVKQTVINNTTPNSFPVNVTGSYTINHSSGTMDLVACLPIFTPGKRKEEWFGTNGIQNPNSRESTLYPALIKNDNLNFIFPNSSSLENDIQRLKWSGRYIISGSVCSPSFRRTTTDDFIGTATIRSGAIGDNYQIRLTYPPSRTGIDTISITRDWLNPRKGDIFSPVFDTLAGTFDNVGAFSWVINPYILQPGDNLIFGWQSPFDPTVFEKLTPDGIFITGSGQQVGQLTIASGLCKVTLYGSQIKNGEEFHDTLNQLLTTNAIHEVIE